MTLLHTLWVEHPVADGAPQPCKSMLESMEEVAPRGASTLPCSPPPQSASQDRGGPLDQFVQPPPISCSYPQSPERMVSSVPVHDVMKGCDVMSPDQAVVQTDSQAPLRCRHLNVLALDVHRCVCVCCFPNW